MFTSKSQQGISLVELILFIIIVSVALAALVLVLNVTIKGSVDPLIHKQALAIAESLLEEVELQDFSNPTGGFTGAATQVNRALFDDVMDYNGFATTGIYPADGSGIVVTGLTNYNVRVAVVKTTVAWGTIPAGEAAQITVTVTDPGGQTLEAVGYRVNY
jgi:MSHA pilin protein MshD